MRRILYLFACVHTMAVAIVMGMVYNSSRLTERSCKLVVTPMAGASGELGVALVTWKET